MNIVTRAEWGALPPTHQTATTAVEAWLHHTAGNRYGPEYMRSMQRFHMESRGWSDIAYNYVVDPTDLTVYVGRGGGIRPGAQKSHNTGTIAICVMGDWRNRTPEPELLDTLADLMVHLHREGWAPKHFDGGHRQAPGQSTTCPGDLVNYIGAINERIDMTYRGVLNVPDADWARRVVDDGIDSGLIIVDDAHQDDWEDSNLTMGRLWTLFHRASS